MGVLLTGASDTFDESLFGDTENSDAITGRTVNDRNFPIIELNRVTTPPFVFGGTFHNQPSKFSGQDNDYFVIDIRDGRLGPFLQNENGSLSPGTVIHFQVFLAGGDNIAIEYRPSTWSFISTTGPYGQSAFYLTSVDGQFADLTVPSGAEAIGFQIINYSGTPNVDYSIDMWLDSSGSGTPGGDGGTTSDFPANTSTPGSVTVGGTRSGNIGSIGDRDWWRVSFVAGVTYVINLGSGTLSDTYLRLYSSVGVLIVENDDFGGSTFSRLTFTATATATYFIGAAAYNDASTGTYNVSVTQSTTSTPPTPTPTPTPATSADLLVSLLALSSDTVEVGGTDNVTLRYGNNGDSSAGASRVGIYLSTDADITHFDTFLGFGVIGALAGHANVTTNVSFTVPASVAPGTYYIGVIADYDNQIVESSDINNFSNTTLIRILSSSTIPEGAHGDFDGNGRSDLIFRQANGGIAEWQFDSAGQLSSAQFLGSVASAWQVEGFGDFDSNNRSDILFRHANGTVAVWQTNEAGQLAAAITLGTAAPSWKVAAIGDFTGEGRDDILLRNDNSSIALWQTNSAGQLLSAQTIGTAAPVWHIVGIGDFDGNNRDDILFRHNNGAVAVWQTNSLGQLTTALQIGTAATSWHIADTGDFDGNGRTDILFFHDNGQLAVWSTNAAGQLAAAAPIGTLSNQWHLAGTGDFNGDGRTDIALRHDSGEVAAWLMNGTQIQAIQSLGNAPTDWTIQLHHYDLL